MNLFARLITMLLLLTTATSVSAVDDDYFAVKFGVLQNEDPAYDPALNLNLAIGGRLWKSEYVAFGMQLEMSTSIMEGDTKTFHEEWEMDSHALYATMHVGQSHYLKLKAGYIDWQVRYDVGEDRNGTGLSWGVAYGYPLKNGHKLELEYTMISDEQDFGINLISLGYYF